MPRPPGPGAPALARTMIALAIGVPRHWTFDAPVRLLLLLLVVGLTVAYLLLQRRRPFYEARFSDVDLLASCCHGAPAGAAASSLDRRGVTGRCAGGPALLPTGRGRRTHAAGCGR